MVGKTMLELNYSVKIHEIESQEVLVDRGYGTLELAHSRV